MKIIVGAYLCEKNMSFHVAKNQDVGDLHSMQHVSMVLYNIIIIIIIIYIKNILAYILVFYFW